MVNTYHAVQKLSISLKGIGQLKWCMAKPRHPFAYQWLDNVKIYYTTLTNFSKKYLVMYKVYTDVGGIK